MLLKRLKLTNFRNLESFDQEFNCLKTIIIGQNAQGKSNILEAINILARSSSDRASKDSELIYFNSEYALINAFIKDKEDDLEISLQLSLKGRRKLKINGVAKRAPQADLIGNFFTVMFSSDDLYLLKGSPSIRRKWIDSNLIQLKSNYNKHFHAYQKAVAQKNALLKNAFESGMSKSELKDQLEVWNEQIVNSGTEILKMRFEYLDEITEVAMSFLKDISRQKENLKLEYLSTIFSDQKISKDISLIKRTFEDKQQELFEDEFRRGQALIGPHRDDLIILINHKEAKSFASQGQQRSIILSLKLSELKVIEQRKGKIPVLLLDDVFAELDESRQDFLLHHLPQGIQTFITTTHISDIQKELLENALVLKIEKGKLAKEPSINLPK